MQNLLVAVIVLACTVYAVWALLPAGWRRALARRLATAPWPAPIKRRLQQASQAGNACGCNGCDRGAAPAAKPEAHPVRFHPRRH
jgi:hypothetical protein